MVTIISILIILVIVNYILNNRIKEFETGKKIYYVLNTKSYRYFIVILIIIGMITVIVSQDIICLLVLLVATPLLDKYLYLSQNK